MAKKEADGGTQEASPFLQLVHAGVGRATDAGDLLPLLPLRQLLGDQVGDQRLGEAQEVRQLHHHILTKQEKHHHKRNQARLDSLIIVFFKFQRNGLT